MRYYSISMTLHLLILLAIGFQFLTPVTETTIGDSDHDAINAYFVQAVSPQETQARSKTGITLKQNLTNMQKANPTQSHAASQGNESAGLLALLHNAIQQQQTYPESALEMGREGRVTIAFQLFRDGHIDHARIARSSGTASLDMAALMAVNRAAPFHDVAQFVDHAENYNIDVVFEMS